MIKLLKISTGEEIVGKIEEQEDGTIKVTNPCAIMLLGSRSTPDQHSMGMIPYAAYTKDHTIFLKPDTIIWEAELEADVYNQYNGIFGSGIQIVPGHLTKTSADNTPTTPLVNIT